MQLGTAYAQRLLAKYPFASDRWSVGAILYALITTKLFIGGGAPNGTPVDDREDAFFDEERWQLGLSDDVRAKYSNEMLSFLEVRSRVPLCCEQPRVSSIYS